MTKKTLVCVTIVKVLWKKENCSRNLVLFKTETPSTLCSVLKWHCEIRHYVHPLLQSFYRCSCTWQFWTAFFLSIFFFYPVWQSVDTRTHLRMLELWTILISPGLTDWDIPQVYLVLYFLFPFMLTEDSDVFVVYFFLCRLSVWCLFFCYQWPKSCSPFIHTWQMWVVCLSMCRVPEFFFGKYPVDIITECLDNYCIYVEDAG